MYSYIRDLDRGFLGGHLRASERPPLLSDNMLSRVSGRATRPSVAFR
eukprot:SAG11_NODE_289_length_11184_cov_20.648083_13_plen_47_part_00